MRLRLQHDWPRACAAGSQRLDGQGEGVADAALYPDDAWRAGIELQLATQPQDLYIDAMDENAAVCKSTGRGRLVGIACRVGLMACHGAA
jgi:hypothetical protein